MLRLDFIWLFWASTSTQIIHLVPFTAFYVTRNAVLHIASMKARHHLGTNITCSVILDKLSNLPVPQFSHLYMGIVIDSTSEAVMRIK